MRWVGFVRSRFGSDEEEDSGRRSVLGQIAEDFGVVWIWAELDRVGMLPRIMKRDGLMD